MAIGRMQMNRQLYGLGSYFPPENGREKFGLGSKLKKFVRKIIPNEVSEIAVKAAPFVAPFNPLLAGYMAGIGGFDQTGRIGSSLKSGLLTYGAGQLARGIGGAGTQGGFNPFAGYNPASSFGGISSLFTSPIGTQTGLQLGQYEMFGGPGSGGDQATRKAIGEQLAQASRDAAVPPGSFIDAGVDSGIKVADYTGELISNTGGEVAKQATRGYMDITKDLFSGDFTTMGNAAKELGGKALKDIYTTPITNQAGEVVGSKVDKTAILATLSAIPSYLDAKKAADDAGIEEFDEATYNAERDKYMERYKTNLPASSFGIKKAKGGIITDRKNYFLGKMVSATSVAQPGKTMSQGGGSGLGGMIANLIQRNPEMFRKVMNPAILTGSSRRDFIDENNDGIDDRLQAANGGRIGYREGTPREGIVSLTDEDSGVVYRDPKTGEPLTTTEFLRRAQEDEDRENQEGEDKELDYGASSITLPKKKTFRERSMEIAVPKQINRELEDKFENYLKKLVTGKKNGGRMGFMMGTEVPMRQNQGGITELDYRKTGGFVPVGVKERADDVPAMLSKNEFVFTADAVRGAGKGDINKGAKMMYAKMKALEGKVKKFKKTKKKKVKV
jgi:hypothetical protein